MKNLYKDVAFREVRQNRCTDKGFRLCVYPLTPAQHILGIIWREHSGARQCKLSSGVLAYIYESYLYNNVAGANFIRRKVTKDLIPQIRRSIQMHS